MGKSRGPGATWPGSRWGGVGRCVPQSLAVAWAPFPARSHLGPERGWGLGGAAQD